MNAKVMAALAMAMAVVFGVYVVSDGSSPQGEDPGPDDAGLVVDWVDSTKVLELSGGWSISACEGDAPLLCVFRHGEPAGVVEAMAYPIASFRFLNPAADDATNLKAIAKDYLSGFVADRKQGCGADYGFAPSPHRSFDLGGVRGATFGFTGKMPDGRPSERHVQYAAIQDGDVIVLAAAAYDEGGCPGPDDVSVSFTSEALAELRPLLDEVLTKSPLPEL